MAEAGSTAAESFDELTRALRGSLASLRAAAETLEHFPRMDDGQQQRLRGVVSGEARRLGELIDRLESLGDRERAESRAAPAVAQVPRRAVAEIAAAIAGRLSALPGLGIEAEEGPPPAGEAVVEIELESLLHALAGLASALRDEFEVRRFQLRRKVVERHAVFDLGWPADAASLDRLRAWQSEALEKLPAGASDAASGLRPLVRRHGGEAWFNVDRDSSRAYLRILLPLAG